MKLREVMKPSPRTVLPDDGLAFARSLMTWSELRHLPVVDDTNHLIGVLSERDVLAFQASGGDLTSATVEAAMQREPRWASPDDSLTEAAARMAEARIGCLPITDKGALVGIVTTSEVLAAEVRIAFEPENHLGTPTVADVMTPDPTCVHPDDLLLEAAAQMGQLRVRHLPVIDGDGHVIGMLSDRDVRSTIGEIRVIDAELPDWVQSLRVADVMSQPVITTTRDQSCADAAAAFVRLCASAVPVVDDDNRVVGIVSYIDLLRGFSAAGALH